jgi:hypothetical protein
MLLSVWFADVHSPLGLHGSWWIFVLLPIGVIPDRADRTQFQFLAGAAIICAVIAINTGLLGSGLLAQIVADVVLAGSFAWVIANAREASIAPVSTTRA